MDDHDLKVLQGAGRAAALGDVLRSLRRRHRISQDAMARHIGINHNSYGYLERGLSPRPGVLTFARLARGHAVSVDLLVRSYLGAEPIELADETVPPAGALPVPPVRGVERPDAMGACVAAMRERAGLTQQSVAKAAGMQRSQVGTIETGGRLNVAITTMARVVRGMAPDANVADAVGLLAQVFAGEIARADFDQRIEIFLGSPPSISRRGLAVEPSGEARRG